MSALLNRKPVLWFLWLRVPGGCSQVTVQWANHDPVRAKPAACSASDGRRYGLRQLPGLQST
jgi:hypothetical protein